MMSTEDFIKKMNELYEVFECDLGDDVELRILYNDDLRYMYREIILAAMSNSTGKTYKKLTKIDWSFDAELVETRLRDAFMDLKQMIEEDSK